MFSNDPTRVRHLYAALPFRRSSIFSPFLWLMLFNVFMSYSLDPNNVIVEDKVISIPKFGTVLKTWMMEEK